MNELDAEVKMYGESLFDLDEQYARELDYIRSKSTVAIGSSRLDALISSEVRQTFPALLLSLPVPEYVPRP